jgi:tetratricopeptide (TPR) repeat protein
MAMLYAKTLNLNKKYEATDKILTGINIIPYEGATDGHELYREAKLMQAVQLIQKNNSKAALKLIDQARLWPENLGVGMPYPEDIDTRLEDWMTYLCYVQQKRTADAENLLNQIIKFEPRVENTVRNFSPSNAIVTAWAYEKLNRRNEAVKWLDRQIKYFPDHKLLLWSKAMFEHDKNFVLHESEKDVNARIVEQIILTTKP